MERVFRGDPRVVGPVPKGMAVWPVPGGSVRMRRTRLVGMLSAVNSRSLVGCLIHPVAVLISPVACGTYLSGSDSEAPERVEDLHPDAAVGPWTAPLDGPDRRTGGSEG